MIKKKNKKGAMQMSMGTIVTIVLLMSVLIMGIILTRNIMCGGIQLSEQINEKMESQVQDLFSSRAQGLKCIGEGKPAEFGSGGPRAFTCFAHTKQKDQVYTIKEVKVEPTNNNQGASKEVINNQWIMDKQTREFSISPGEENKIVPVLFNIPQEVPETTMKIIVKGEDKSGSPIESTSYITVTTVGGFTKAMC